jgi:hypothetical protein
MAPGLRLFFERFFAISAGLFPRLVLTAVVLVGVAIPAWYARDQIVSSSYYDQPKFWAGVGDKLGHDGGVVGLTEDYGYRLAYWGWQHASNWFTSADIGLRYLAGQNVDLIQTFKHDTAGKKYFLVTMFGELDKEPAVKDLLYKDYPIYAQGPYYVIFDLQHPLKTQP